MTKKFGIKEARAAESFAASREQKQTVLAVVKMLGLPNVLEKQVGGIVDKLHRSINTRITKIDDLEAKANLLKIEVNRDETYRDDLLSTQITWDI